MNPDPDSVLAGYAMLPGWIYSLGLSGMAIALYGLLANSGTYDAASGTYQGCQPRRKLLAARLGCSIATVRRALLELVESGAVTRAQRYAASGAQLPSEYIVWHHPALIQRGDQQI